MTRSMPLDYPHFAQFRREFDLETQRQAANVRRDLLATGATPLSASEQVESFIELRNQNREAIIDTVKLFRGEPPAAALSSALH